MQLRVPHEFMSDDFIVVIGSLSTKSMGGYFRSDYYFLYQIMRCGFVGDIRIVDPEVPWCLVAFTYPAWFRSHLSHRLGTTYQWVASEDLRVVGSLDGLISRFKASQLVNSQ